MIDPIIYTIRLGSLQIPIRWYGLLIVFGSLAGAWYAAWYVKKRGEDSDIIWDALIWMLISGIVGARIWYVIADIIGGNPRYLEDPVQILYINRGGLNILGGIVVAGIVAWFYTKAKGVDFWLIADAAGPALLIGQAIGRLGNYINQELYGPPTTLPWGISIEATHRLAPWNDMTQFPFETTRFHPTFAYQMIWNLFWAAMIIWYINKKDAKITTGVIAGFWLVVAGVGRMWIELFRPDQPRFFNTSISTSTIVAFLFAIVGLLIVLVKLEKIKVPFMNPGSDEYNMKRKSTRRPARQR